MGTVGLNLPAKSTWLLKTVRSIDTLVLGTNPKFASPVISGGGDATSVNSKVPLAVPLVSQRLVVSVASTPSKRTIFGSISYPHPQYNRRKLIAHTGFTATMRRE